MSVLLGDGEGGLSLDRQYRTGILPRELAVGRFNDDEVDDLVVAAGRGADWVDVFLGNGDGTFSGPVRVTTGPRPNSVAIADFDANGRSDIAVANWSLDNESQASMSILFGNGEGLFPEKKDFIPPFPEALRCGHRRPRRR